MKRLPNTAGVYRCTAPNGSWYIGRAQDMQKRRLAHESDARRGAHKNERLGRTLKKYGKRVKWDVLLHTDSAETALHFEAQYLEMFWGDPLLMNQRKGDAITAIENERRKRVPCYAMNVWTRGVVRLNYKGEPGAMFAMSRQWKPSVMVCAETTKECERLADKQMIKWVQRAALRLQRERDKRRKAIESDYHVRNIHTGYVGRATQKELREWGVCVRANKQFYKGWQWRKFGEEWQWDCAKHRKVSVYGLHVTGVMKQWRSVSDCERELGPGVNNALSGRKKTYKGHILRYLPLWGAENNRQNPPHRRCRGSDL